MRIKHSVFVPFLSTLLGSVDPDTLERIILDDYVEVSEEYEVEEFWTSK